MTRGVGQKNVLGLKHILTSVGEWKVVSPNIFPTFGIGPWIIVNVLNLCETNVNRIFCLN